MYRVGGTYDYYFVTDAAYETWLASDSAGEGCFWSGPFADGQWEPSKGGLRELEDKCTDGAGGSFNFSCYNYIASSINGLYYDYCLANGKYISYRELNENEKTATGIADGWIYSVKPGKFELRVVEKD